jgi:hypothetical protein
MDKKPQKNPAAEAAGFQARGRGIRTPIGGFGDRSLSHWTIPLYQRIGL